MATAPYNPMARNAWRGAAPGRGGYTFLELIVAMMVFGVALAGMFPLLVLLSRDLQPLERRASDGSTYNCTTPARDGVKTGEGLTYTQHTWYLTPFDQPWARKLGAGVRVTSNTTAFTSASPVAVDLPDPITRDDDASPPDSDGDDVLDYTESGSPPSNDWTPGVTGSSVPDRNDYRRFPSLPAGQTPGYAYWNFTTTTAGWYAVEATWPTNVGVTVATDAQFGISVGGVQVATSTVNEQVASNEEQDSAGTWWKKLATVYVPANTRVTVSLHANPSDQTTYVVADGVRLVAIENTVRIDGPPTRSPSKVNSNTNHEDVTVRASVTIALPQAP